MHDDNFLSMVKNRSFPLHTNIIKVVGEWKAKADDLHAELDACHSEWRNFSAETFRLKAALAAPTARSTSALEKMHACICRDFMDFFFFRISLSKFSNIVERAKFHEPFIEWSKVTQTRFYRKKDS